MAVKYSDLFIKIRNSLRDTGIETYKSDTQQIICMATGKTNAEFMRDMALYASPEMEEKALKMAERRIQGEPVSYITGLAEFYGMPFYVTPDVLIPRMDTEVLVEHALQILNEKNRSGRILDLCCGSGCIGCAITHELPATRIVAIDISAKALQVCRKNVEINHLSPRVICMQSDAKSSPPMGIGTFDMIVCNPPYIRSDEMDTLDRSVRDYEPSWALDGGTDGLDFYRSIIKHWKYVLKPEGSILFEVGEDQAEPVSDFLTSEGYQKIELYKDTINVDRVVKAEI